jgi:hypothetical protein
LALAALLWKAKPLSLRPEDGVLILRPNKVHHLKVGSFYRLKI